MRYGKLTGRAAACFAIAGPGSTNLLTGLYDARVDRAPALAISGQVPSKVKGRGAFQDLDLDRAFADVALYSQTVQAGSDHAELMTMACKHAIVGRGVAHLVLPDEVQVEPSDATAGGPDGRVADRRVAPPADVLRNAGARLRSPASVPSSSSVTAHATTCAQVVGLADRLGAPVLTTFKAKGLVSDHHPLGAGVLGRSGTPVASYLMNESDLLVVWGASFSNHTGIAPYKPIVQVDDDPMALGRFHSVESRCWATSASPRQPSLARSQRHWPRSTNVARWRTAGRSGAPRSARRRRRSRSRRRRRRRCSPRSAATSTPTP